jgi:hypothetical protein
MMDTSAKRESSFSPLIAAETTDATHPAFPAKIVSSDLDRRRARFRSQLPPSDRSRTIFTVSHAYIFSFRFSFFAGTGVLDSAFTDLALCAQDTIQA